MNKRSFFVQRSRFVCMAVLVLSALNASAANYGKMDYESRIRETLREILLQADPAAQIIVSVKFKEQTVVLPGTSTTVESLVGASGPGQLSLDDVQSVRIRIISRIDPFPQNLTQTLRNSLGDLNKKSEINIEKMDPVTLSIIEAHGAIPGVRSAQEKADHSDAVRFTTVAVIFGLSLLVVFVVFFTMTFRRLNFLVAKSVELQAQNAQNNGEQRRVIDIGNQSEQRRPNEAQTALTDSNSDSDRTALHLLSPAALVALLSDCYWAEEDGYAAWLWTGLLPAQCSQVLSLWPEAREYVGSIAQVSHKPASHHLHPYYLQPLDINRVNMSDLSKWVKLNAGAWHLLSPIRRMKLSFSMKERFEASAQKLSHPERRIIMPAPSRETRKLAVNMEIGTVTLADELEIFTDPRIVPTAMRRQVKSLVWLALLERPLRASILENLSAQDIAQAWVGPDEVLNFVADAIPEKKLGLIKDYRTKRTPTRNNEVMDYLVAKALDESPGVESADEEVPLAKVA